jgi:hypothetical protein
MIILKESIVHHSEISIESKLTLLAFEWIDLVIDLKQVVLRVGIKSIFMEEHEMNYNGVIAV